MEYKNITEYIRKNMKDMHEDFVISSTDVSEKEDGCVRVLIHPSNKDGESAHFYLYADGKEEYITM